MVWPVEKLGIEGERRVELHYVYCTLLLLDQKDAFKWRTRDSPYRSSSRMDYTRGVTFVLPFTFSDARATTVENAALYCTVLYIQVPPPPLSDVQVLTLGNMVCGKSKAKPRCACVCEFFHFLP